MGGDSSGVVCGRIRSGWEVGVGVGSVSKKYVRVAFLCGSRQIFSHKASLISAISAPLFTTPSRIFAHHYSL